MFTLWYDKILAHNVGYASGQTELDFKDLNGDTRQYYYSTNLFSNDNTGNLMNTVMTGTYIGRGLAFGSGTTPPTREDYYLSGEWIKTFTHTKTTTTVKDPDGCTRTTTYTITNTGSEEFTIGEIALFAAAAFNSSTSTYFLAERTVLDKPVTIAPGAVGQVVYSIRMNYPTK